MSRPEIPVFERIEIDSETALRPLTIDDAPAMYETIVANTDHLAPFMENWAAISREGVSYYCKQAVQGMKAGRVAAYNIIHQGEFAGHARLDTTDRRLDMPELIGWISKDFAGKGIGRKALVRGRDSYVAAGVPRVALLINPRNIRSQRIAQGAGLELRVTPFTRFKSRLPVALRLGDDVWIMSSQVEALS